MKRVAVGGVLVATLVAVAAGLYVLMNANTFQLFGEITARVPTSQRVVALTFDDGPTPMADDVLAILAEHDAAATFFLTGSEVSEHPELGRRIRDAGHELANHSWSHERMLLMPRSRIAEEIERTDAILREQGQTEPILFRPPYGKKLFGLPRYLADHDRHTVMADVEPESDPAVAADADRLVDVTVDNVSPGSIVVLHTMYEANDPTRQALPEILERLAADGYRFVTVSELLELADR